MQDRDSVTTCGGEMVDERTACTGGAHERKGRAVMEDRPSKRLYKVTLAPYPEAAPYVMFVAKGERLDEPPMPRLSHCACLGWFRDGDAQCPWDFERDCVQEDMVLCVRWRTTVTYFTEPDRPFATAPGVVGECAQQLAAPIASGPHAGSCTFAGWYYDRACTDPWDFHRDRIYPDTRLYAKWVTSE